jgi:hypothetical protein
VEETLFSLAATEGEVITTLDLRRAPGWVLKLNVSRPGLMSVVSQPVIDRADVEHAIATLATYLPEHHIIDVMDAFSDLGPEFAAAIAELKFQRYGLVRAQRPT